MKHIAPPPWAVRLLTRLHPTDTLEEVEGDLAELYVYWYSQKGKWQADLLYIWAVLSVLPPFVRRRSQKHTYSHTSLHLDMIRNYLLIALRNLFKNKVYSFINISGLAVGLACCISIGLYIWDEHSHDRFHSNYDHLYRVVEQQTQGGVLYHVATTPGPLAPVMKADFSQVKQTCRIATGWWAGSLQVDDKRIIPANVLVVDNTFFSLFNFPLVVGNPQKALLRPDEVVISHQMATRLFGTYRKNSGSILGQQIKLKNGRMLTLAGVAQDPPAHSHIQFDVLLSGRFNELNEKDYDYNWNSNNYHTYVLLDPQANIVSIQHALAKYLDKYSPEQRANVKTTLSLQAFSDIYLYSDFAFHTDWGKRGNITYIHIFLAVGTIVLLIAVFNFVNLTTARAMNRAKEVGVRKVIGALYKQLITQFLSESLMMTLLAVILALFLSGLFLPLINDIAGKSLLVPLNEPDFLLTLLVFTLIVGLLAGMYPAFYLANFKPARVLKGFAAGQPEQIFRRVLVVSQFTLSLVLIAGTIVIHQQLQFIQNKHLGFDQSQLIYMESNFDVRDKVSLMKTDLEEQTSIARVAATSSNLVDERGSTINIAWEGQTPGDEFLMSHVNVDPQFLSTTGMTLVAGRNFDAAFEGDTSLAYLINETAARRMGWTPEQAIGKRFTFWQTKGHIIGVVKDFHFRPMTTQIAPLLFRCWPKAYYSGLFVKAKAGRVREAIALIEKTYKKYHRESPPSYEFIDEVLENQYRTEQNTARIVLYFSILAIMVSCLGLFGLATYTAEKRTKEIGVRKVLGASVSSIVVLLSTGFLRLILMAIFIASPIAWYVLHKWLQNFAYSIAIDWWIFAFTGLLTVGVGLLTVSFQAVKAALVNPVKSLRSE